MTIATGFVLMYIVTPFFSVSQPLLPTHCVLLSGISEWSERRRETRESYTPERRSPPAFRDRYSPVDRSSDYRLPRATPSPVRASPVRDTTPTPPQRKRGVDRRQRISQDSRYDSGYRTPSRNDTREEPVEEPPPDYSPPSPPPMPVEKKQQKTRFAADPPKAKSGNIIGECFCMISYLEPKII